MKSFSDVKAGDTVYRLIYDPYDILVAIKKEKVTAIEVVKSGTVMKTEDVSNNARTHGYFIDEMFYNSQLIYNGSTDDEIHWDKDHVKKIIDDCLNGLQMRYNKMLDYIKN